MKKTNAQWMQENGYKFSDIGVAQPYQYDKFIIYISEKCPEDSLRIVEKVNAYDKLNALEKWLDAEHKEQLLTDSEKQYLAAIIKPFRSRFQYVTKERNSCGEWLHFVLTTDSFSLPFFKPGTMYKNLRPHINYTLEDLGL